MDRRTEENVLRWLKEKLDQEDLIESEQEEDLIEEENIVHSPHDIDTKQEDQADENYCWMCQKLLNKELYQFVGGLNAVRFVAECVIAAQGNFAQNATGVYVMITKF